MTYATRSDVESEYGTSNVTLWADLDGDEDASAITARITAALEAADSYFNSRLTGAPYTVPWTTSVPSEITRHAALWAGVYLYEARGVTDYNPVTGAVQHRLQFQKRQVDTFLKDVRRGRVILAGRLGTYHAPHIVGEASDE